MLTGSQHAVEPGLGGRLRAHRSRLALWIAVVEGVVVAFSHDATKWTVFALAVVALLAWVVARDSSSSFARQLLWVFAASQLLALILVLLAVVVKWAVILGLVVFAVLGLVFLLVDRR